MRALLVLFVVAVGADAAAPGPADGVEFPLPRTSLTFSFADWPSAADEDSLTLDLNRIVPILTDLLGEPAVANHVIIRYRPDLTNTAIYYAELNPPEIQFRIRPTTFAAFPVNLAHELTHAWRHRYAIQAGGCEEGLAKACEFLVVDRLPQHIQDAFVGTGHKDYNSVLEQTANQPAAAAQNGNFSLVALGNRRYALAGWAFWRLEQESRGRFLHEFHQDYFAQCRRDPSLPSSPDAVVNLMSYHNPVVDGQPFADWWSWYQVMTLHPPTGNVVFAAADRIGVITYRRDPYNDFPVPGVNVDYEVRDAHGGLLAAGTVASDANGNAFPGLQFPNSTGRATATYRAHFLDEEVDASQLYYLMPSMPSIYAGFGLFGVVDGPDGPLTVAALDQSVTIETAVVNGTFSVPALDGVAGAFRIVWNNRTTVVRKDRAPYLVAVTEQTMHQIGVADATPAPSITIGASAPNPFHSTTMIPFDVPSGREVRLTVYDVGGRAVRTILAGYRARGSHEISWDGRNNNGQPVPSGVYFLRTSESGTPIKITRLP